VSECTSGVSDCRRRVFLTEKQQFVQVIKNTAGSSPAVQRRICHQFSWWSQTA